MKGVSRETDLYISFDMINKNNEMGGCSYELQRDRI